MLVLSIYHYASTTPFWNCCFVVNFEMKKCESSDFVFLFQDCFSYLGHLKFYMEAYYGFYMDDFCYFYK